jgi:hypothetical protein
MYKSVISSIASYSSLAVGSLKVYESILLKKEITLKEGEIHRELEEIA